MTTVAAPTESAAQAVAYTEEWLPGPHNHPFYTRTYAPSEETLASVVHMHGFAEHVGRHEDAHAVWALRGVAVFAFDQRGFGRTALDKEGKRAKDEAYGKTCHTEQMQDIEWAVQHARRKWEGVPIFLAGQSMGGGLALAFPTQSSSPPSTEVTSMLSGVVACSPLLTQTVPAPKILRKVGGTLALVAPWIPFPVNVPPEDLSHDVALNEATYKDQWIRRQGTLRGVADMLNRGEELLRDGHKRWPKTLPLLILHGTADKVTSHKASEDFFNKVDAEDKKLSLYPDGFHELTHEPHGVKERFWDECISWILDHAERSRDNAQLAKL